MKNKNTEMMIKVSIMAALAAVVMVFSFPIPFAPPFYKIDLSETIVLLAGFALGPIPAIAVEALKNVLYFLLNGSTTLGIGEFANFLMGCAFVVPASYLYHKNKTQKQAIISLIIASISLSIVGTLVNYFILLPVYAYFFDMPLDALIGMGTAINSNINNLFTFVVLATLPFNLLKALINSLVVLVTYKKINPILK